MRAPTTNRITQVQHLPSRSVDHAAWPDPYVYAPEAGTINSYQWRGSGTNSAGNTLRLEGATGLHQFAHLERTYVKPGQKVKAGQKLAKMGYTGYTIPEGPNGAHLHYWIMTPRGYVYPPTLYKQAKGGEVANSNQVKEIYRAVLHRSADKGGLQHYTGKDANEIVGSMLNSQEWKNHDKFNKTANQAIKDLQKANKALSSRPTKAELETYAAKAKQAQASLEAARKELEEARSRPSDVVEKNPAWLESAIMFIRNVLRIK